MQACSKKVYSKYSSKGFLTKTRIICIDASLTESEILKEKKKFSSAQRN